MCGLTMTLSNASTSMVFVWASPVWMARRTNRMMGMVLIFLVVFMILFFVFVFQLPPFPVIFLMLRSSEASEQRGEPFSLRPQTFHGVRRRGFYCLNP